MILGLSEIGWQLGVRAEGLVYTSHDTHFAADPDTWASRRPPDPNGSTVSYSAAVSPFADR